MSPEEASLKLKKDTRVSCYETEAMVSKGYSKRYPTVVSVQLVKGAQKTSWFIKEIKLV